VQDCVQALSREQEKKKEPIVNGRRGTVIKSGKQTFGRAGDDQLIELLNDAEMKSVGHLCED
jgi:hypothetical protein